jgi:hypothetical protein
MMVDRPHVQRSTNGARIGRWRKALAQSQGTRDSSRITQYPVSKFPAPGVILGIDLLMARLVGMALGGWMSGTNFDLTGSYRAAFPNGTASNLLDIVDRGLAPARLPAPRASA